MRVAILQPMYLPWMGYFGFIQLADTFVFYDDVQFLRDSWQRRNRIKVPEDSGRTKWLTVPVVKDKGQCIDEVQVRTDLDWRVEHWDLIRQAYGPESVPFGPDVAPYFVDYADRLATLYDQEWIHLSNFTTSIIESLCEPLALTDTELLYSSSLDIGGSGTERLIRVLNDLGADEYVSGPSGKDYLDVSLFEANDITLYWHEFDHPTYNQLYGEFESHMSVVDLLFNTGPAAADLLRSAEQDSLVREPGT